MLLFIEDSDDDEIVRGSFELDDFLNLLVEVECEEWEDGEAAASRSSSTREKGPVLLSGSGNEVGKKNIVSLYNTIVEPLMLAFTIERREDV